MRLKFSKVAVLILLPVFLITTVGSIPGYAWCFGEDGHVESLKVETVGCSNGEGENSSSVNPDEVSVAPLSEEHCGPCVDFYIQLNEATSTKRLKNESPVSIDATTINNSPLISSQGVKMVVGNLVSQPTPRTSQTILNHRTVVLLN